MKVTIKPSKAYGAVTAPPSKSMAHRLLICAGLARGESAVRNLAMSKDVSATVECLRALGAEVRLDGDTAYVRGADVRCDTLSRAVLPCGECGSTLRFFVPLCLLSGAERTLTGTEYLMSRPLSVYEELCLEQGLRFDRTAASLTVQGVLSPGIYEVRGDISSQFISGLMFALPLLSGDSKIRLLPPVESRPYIDMTVAALRAFGVEIGQSGDTYTVKGAQEYSPRTLTVEGDCSNAAFFEALNYMGGDVRVQGLSPDTLQGDAVYKELFDSIRRGGADIDISDCPDLGPVLFAVAAACHGARFRGTRRLRLKESDRADAMRYELNKFGVTVEVGENTVEVSGGLCTPSEPLYGHGDHRIVMALSVLAALTGGVIEGAQSVDKSFPDFFDRLRELNVEVDTDGMD